MKIITKSFWVLEEEILHELNYKEWVHEEEILYQLNYKEWVVMEN